MPSSLLEVAKPIVAMGHLGPLPGSPGYDAGEGVDGLIRAVMADIEHLQAGGVDAILFCNEGDRPYVLRAPAEGLAAMAAIVAAVKPILKVPFGVNYIWDPYATVALAVATGASFAREVFTGVYASDMGLWQPDAAGASRLRARLGRTDLKLMFNINAEFADSLDKRPIEKRAQSAVFSSLADIICVSGPRTGQPVDASDLRKVKAALPDCPVFANTGVDLDNVAEILAVADGCVVGTHLKVDGDTWNPVDGERVTRFMDRVRGLR